MRLPIPFILYAAALSLFGCAGWIVFTSLDLWTADTQNAASVRGRDDALRFIANGKGKGPQSSSWNYAAGSWWPQVKEVNLIGKLPERKPTAEEIANASKPVEVVVDVTPLEDIFELVSLVYDGKGDGKGENSHVIIRYKPEAGVEPPEWWVRENTPAASAGAGRRGPRDLAAAPATATTSRSRRGGRGNQARPRPMPSAMPTSITGREILQKIWVDDGGNLRRSPSLWGKYSHIRLVRVDASAESAFFSRTAPANEGEPKVEAKEEELLKTSAEIPQDVLLALRRLQGREGDKKSESKIAGSSAAKPNQWREVENTTRYGDQFHIGRKDERSFQDTDEFFSSVHVDTYVSKSSSMRGLSVRNIKSDVAQKFGVQTGDVLIEVNNRPVSSKAQAVNMVKKDYGRGVRSFSTKWLSNGQVVNRVYLAPAKK